MAFQLDRRNRLSYAAQVQRQALAHLVAGRLHPGDRLPSVRQLARDLGISRTTAERIQDVLCDSMLAEVRPRSGAFVASPDGVTHHAQSARVQATYEFLRQTIRQARQLGLSTKRLSELIGALDEDALDGNLAVGTFAIIDTRDAFDCMRACFDPSFPAHIVHLPANAAPPQVPADARYVLTGYYLRGRARKIADAVQRPLLYVRYNVALFDRALACAAQDGLAFFVTRDADNAETTRGLLTSAYPEVAPTRYRVLAAKDFRTLALRGETSRGSVWPTITAAPLIRDIVPDSRVELMHPVLADDFIEELRRLALLG